MPNDIDDAVYQQLAIELTKLEDDTAALQAAKRSTYTRIRTEHGKPAAENMKAVMRLMRTTDEKLEATVRSDMQARAIVQMLKRSGILADGQVAAEAGTNEGTLEAFEETTASRDLEILLLEPNLGVAGPTTILADGSVRHETDKTKRGSSDDSQNTSPRMPARIIADPSEVEDLVIPSGG